jgi:ribosome-associated protein
VFSGKSAAEVAKMHRLERLREQLLEDDKAIGTLVELWPQVDVQYLRTLRRNALKERETAKPPKAFREIFRVLRELQDAQDAAAEDDVAVASQGAQDTQGSEGAEGENGNLDARA